MKYEKQSASQLDREASKKSSTVDGQSLPQFPLQTWIYRWIDWKWPGLILNLLPESGGFWGDGLSIDECCQEVAADVLREKALGHPCPYFTFSDFLPSQPCPSSPSPETLTSSSNLPGRKSPEETTYSSVKCLRLFLALHFLKRNTIGNI